MLQTTAFFINQSHCLFRGDLLCLLPEEEVSFRRGAWVVECCPGMSELRWLSRAGPALPAWWCVSDRRCKVCGWVFKGPSVAAPCYSQQRVWGRWPIWRGARGWTAELHHSCSAHCSGAVADSDPAWCMWLLAVKTQCSVCSLHSTSPETFLLKYGFWNLL